jgi:transposase
MRALLAADMPVHQINPFKLRQFAKASGVLAKSDRLDALVGWVSPRRCLAERPARTD